MASDIYRFLDALTAPIREAGGSGELCGVAISAEGEVVRTEWAKASNLVQLEEFAKKFGQTCNTYISGGIYRSRESREAEYLKGILGYRLDVDFGTDGHKKANLPPDEAAAMHLLDELGLKPSVLINSGHGLQAWFLPKRANIFRSQENRREAARVAYSLNQALLAKSQAHGWAGDSVHDLPRIFRFPDTVNLKPAKDGTSLPPVKASLVYLDGPRYSNEEILAVCPDAGDPPSAEKWGEFADDSLAIDPARKPRPEILLHASAEFGDQKFCKTWNRKRDRELEDPSTSGYDMSIAAQLARFEIVEDDGGKHLCTDQEILDTLVHLHAHVWNTGIKSLQYYRRTIGKAKASAEDENRRTKAAEDFERVDDREDLSEGEKRAEKLKHASAMFGLEIVDVVKRAGFDSTSLRQGARASYTIVTPIAHIPFACSDDLLKQERFNAIVADYAGTTTPFIKREEWRARVTPLIGLSRVEDLGDEATDLGRFRGLLSQYLATTKVLPDIEAALGQGKNLRNAFEHEGKQCINVPTFMDWLQHRRGVKDLKPARVIELLRELGAAHGWKHTNRTTLYYWALPVGWDKPVAALAA